LGSVSTGDTRVSGGREWKYYSCPVANRRVTSTPDGEPLTCANRRVPASLVEDTMLRLIGEARLPDNVLEDARALLKERLAKPSNDAATNKRRRLERALDSLRKQHTWGDLSDEQYRDERLEIEADLARLPAAATDSLIAFDEARVRLLSLPDALLAASSERRVEIVRLLVARVEANRTEGMTALQWTPPAAPFFRLLSSERAVWDSNPRLED
jgi:hypothetical protein